jgi:ABC-2 type transport system ATP-binding protein
MNSSILSFKQVNKRYGKALAVEELSLDLAPGEVFALLGPNGSGKSTALRMALDLIRPCSGQIQVLGRPAAKLNAATRAQIGYVAESHTLPNKMTLKQLLDYLRPMYPAWDDALMQRLIDLFGLPMDQRCRHFSRGMRMKTAFVCALAYHPKLLVLDEPFSGLDPQVMRDLIEALVDMLADEGMTVLISSHDGFYPHQNGITVRLKASKQGV